MQHESFITRYLWQTTPALPTQKLINAGYRGGGGVPEAILGLVGVFCEALPRNTVFEPWIIKSYADTYNSVKYNIADCIIN